MAPDFSVGMHVQVARNNLTIPLWIRRFYVLAGDLAETLETFPRRSQVPEGKPRHANASARWAMLTASACGHFGADVNETQRYRGAVLAPVRGGVGGGVGGDFCRFDVLLSGTSAETRRCSPAKDRHYAKRAAEMHRFCINRNVYGFASATIKTTFPHSANADLENEPVCQWRKLISISWAVNPKWGRIYPAAVCRVRLSLTTGGGGTTT